MRDIITAITATLTLGALIAATIFVTGVAFGWGFHVGWGWAA